MGTRSQTRAPFLLWLLGQVMGFSATPGGRDWPENLPLLPALCLWVSFKFFFSLTYFLSECRRFQQAVPTPWLIWKIFREGKKTPMVIWFLYWLGHNVAGISGLAFVCVCHDTLIIQAVATATQTAVAQTLRWLHLLYISWLTLFAQPGPQLSSLEAVTMVCGHSQWHFFYKSASQHRTQRGFSYQDQPNGISE